MSVSMQAIWSKLSPTRVIRIFFLQFSSFNSSSFHVNGYEEYDLIISYSYSGLGTFIILYNSLIQLTRCIRIEYFWTAADQFSTLLYLIISLILILVSRMCNIFFSLHFPVKYSNKNLHTPLGLIRSLKFLFILLPSFMVSL